MNLELTSSAQLDAAQTALNYEMEKSGLGTKFETELDAVLGRIAGGPKHFGRCRRAEAWTNGGQPGRGHFCVHEKSTPIRSFSLTVFDAKWLIESGSAIDAAFSTLRQLSRRFR